MHFKDFVLNQINSGLFEVDTSGLSKSEANEVFFMFNYFNEELDIWFEQGNNALWKINEDKREIKGLMPLTKEEFFCYMLYAQNLVAYGFSDEKDLIIMCEKYLQNHFIVNFYEDFKTFISTNDL